MTAKMLRFVTLGRSMPEKRGAEARREDFDEIYADFAPEHAADQASRCSQCGVPFCQVHCPVHNNIPDWLKLAAEGRLEEAYEVSSATNNFPEICGRICPQDRLCEGNCVIEQAGHGTVTIGAIEKFITDTAWEKGWVKPVKARQQRRQTVGIVGAGPAGLAAAEELRRQGYQVTIYDRYDRAGGLLIYGIPNFKLEKDVVQRRAALLVEEGVTFKLNFEVGRDASLEALRQRHDAILIACGVYKARDIQAPGVGLGHIVPALDYLTASNRTSLGDSVPAFAEGTLDARGKNVVVIGGGEAGRPRADDADRLAALPARPDRLDPALLPGGVGDEFLDGADGDGAVARLLDDAIAFAEPVLRADAPADFGEIVGRGGNLVGLLQPPLGRELQPVGNIVMDRAMHLAEGHAALRAAAGLVGRLVGGEVGIDLVEILAPRLGPTLFRHGPPQGHETQHLGRHGFPLGTLLPRAAGPGQGSQR
jgi:hypothetical protein